MLQVTIKSMTKGIVTNENGETFEVTTSFHARRLDGEYKYHEVYVYLNKHPRFKDEFKAPKTLKQKWFFNEETRKFRSLGKSGISLLNYEETIGTNTRCKFDINELEFE